MLLRFVEGRPLSWATCCFLHWVCQRLEEKGKQVWALVWDNASWHIIQQIQAWIDKQKGKTKRWDTHYHLPFACQESLAQPY